MFEKGFKIFYEYRAYKLFKIKDEAGEIVKDVRKLLLDTNKTLHNLKHVFLKDSYLKQILVDYDKILTIIDKHKILFFNKNIKNGITIQKAIDLASDILERMKETRSVISNFKFEKTIKNINLDIVKYLFELNNRVNTNKTHGALFNEYIKKIKPEIEKNIINSIKLGVLPSPFRDQILTKYMNKANNKYKPTIQLLKNRRYGIKTVSN